MTTWYGWKSPSIACTASYTAACTTAKSRIDAGPRLALLGTKMAWEAMAFQSATASALADGAAARDVLTMTPRRVFEILITVFSSATRPVRGAGMVAMRTRVICGLPRVEVLRGG